MQEEANLFVDLKKEMIYDDKSYRTRTRSGSFKRKDMTFSVWQNSRPHRTAAGIVTILLLVAMLFSVLFLAVEAGHDCEEEHCPICECIRQCESSRRQFGTGAAVMLRECLPPLLFFAILTEVFFRLTSNTLITAKVRLND